MTVTQAAEMLGLRPSVVRRYVQTGRLRAERVNPRLYLVDAASLEEFRQQPRPRGWPKGRPRKPKEE